MIFSEKREKLPGGRSGKGTRVERNLRTVLAKQKGGDIEGIIGFA